MKLCGRRFLLLIALTVLPAAAQADSSFGRFHALVIGNQNYRHLTKLQTPLADAKEVAEVLETQYGFSVKLLLDKSRDEIKLALSELRKTMTDEQDSLLIYYTGHGYLDNVTGTGYWQPVDAEKDNDVYWLPTDEIARLLKAIRARHVLIVADSCYSGSLLMRDSGARLPAAASRDEWLKRMQAKRSRTALTSGGEEPVADGGGSGHSVFAKALLEVLRENKEILDGDSLFDQIKRPVILNAEQTPLYGDIKMTGHEMGDFLLVPKELREGGIQEQPERKGDLDFLKRRIQSDVIKDNSGEYNEKLEVKLGESIPIQIRNEIVKITPHERIWLTLTNIDQGGTTMKIVGMALTNQVLAEYLDALEGSPYLSAVTLQSAGLTEYAGRSVKTFDLSCTVSR